MFAMYCPPSDSRIRLLLSLGCFNDGGDVAGGDVAVSEENKRVGDAPSMLVRLCTGGVPQP